jgi:hypothetical protein
MNAMKIVTRLLGITAAIICLFCACTKENRSTYVEDPRVYFSKFITNADSVVYSFGIKPVTRVDDTVYLTVRIMGSAVKFDRVMNIKVSDTSKAKAGYHYKIGSMIMPADSFQVRVPVYLYRKPGLKDSIVTIDFIMGESKDFKPGYGDIPSTNYKLDRLHYKIALTDQLLKPGNWDSQYLSVFGAYSRVKFQFMINATGKTDWTSTPYPGDKNFLVQQVKYALYQYELVNGPLIDENGEHVVLP